LFGHGQKGELDRMQDETHKLRDRVIKIEQANDRSLGASEEKDKERASFYTRAALIFAAVEVLIHGLGWAKDVAFTLMSGGRHP
ncbi:MAG: hypothetical protein ACLGXA_20465, partial [Acidobacteriota bacterium]